MNKLLTFLLLIPMYVSPETISVDKFGNCKYEIYNTGGSIVCATKDDYDKYWRTVCASRSGKANNEYSAKKIYKYCLDEKDIKDK